MGGAPATQGGREIFRSNGERGIDGESKRLIPSDATYASKTQCKQTYVQISCLSFHSGGVLLVFRTAKTARSASSLVMTSPNGQVTMVVSAGISSPATIL